MANNENLKPFKPGQSGNPKGRPKGIGADALLKELLETTKRSTDPITGERHNKTMMERILWRLIMQGDKGVLKAIEIIIERTQGKPIQKIESEPNEAIADLNKIMQQIHEDNNGIKPKTTRDTTARRKQRTRNKHP